MGKDGENALRSHKAKVHNERMELLVAVGKAVIIGLIGLGFLRFALDPEAPSVGLWQFGLTVIAVIAAFAGTWFVIGLKRPE